MKSHQMERLNTTLLHLLELWHKPGTIYKWIAVNHFHWR